MKTRRSNSAQRSTRPSPTSPHSRRPSTPDTLYTNQRKKEEYQTLVEELSKAKTNLEFELKNIDRNCIAKIQKMTKKSHQKIKELQQIRISKRKNIFNVVSRYLIQEQSSMRYVTKALAHNSDIFFTKRNQCRSELTRFLTQIKDISNQKEKLLLTTKCMTARAANSHRTQYVYISFVVLNSYNRIRYLCK